MSTPRFSIVSAVHDASVRLGDVNASIEAQTFPRDRVEIVTVPVGSSGGAAAARNVGLGRATGEWVGFVDSDHTIGPGYLTAVDAFLTRYPEVAAVATRPICIRESNGVRENHTWDRFFVDGDRLIDLAEWSDVVPATAAGTFVARDRLRASGVEFDERLGQAFADEHFLARYLLGCAPCTVGLVGSAQYTVRKRREPAAELTTSLMSVEKFSVVPRLGYLDLLQRGAERFGEAPPWIQEAILWDISWFFGAESRGAGAQTVAVGDVATEFHAAMQEIAALWTPGVVERFDARPFPAAWRDYLLHAYGPTPWRPTRVLRDRRDWKQRLMRVRYRYTGPPPEERFAVDGVHLAPVHAKSRRIAHFDGPPMWERVLWLPIGDLSVRLDGNEVEVATAERRPPSRPAPATTRTPADQKVRRLRFDRDDAVRRLAKTRLVRRYFDSAWVLMDRAHDADDSGEHLFRHLRRHHPKINAWFVLEKGTPDYARLRGDGYRRVVPHGSLAWRLLMLNCRHLISSHADQAVWRPPGLKKLIPAPTWRFTFLQHGVIKDDLSSWLNPRNIDLFVTSTIGEYESVCGEGTPYIYTTKETVLTGLPRFDELLREGRRFPPEERDLILIAPTWRDWLVEPLAPGTQRRTADKDFQHSEFAREWASVISSSRLAGAARERGLTIATLLHPNLQGVDAQRLFPPHVTNFGFAGTNVRELVARATVLITDYSSMAFNAAYIDRPVVYFPFDLDRMQQGGHVGKKGYFDYQRDGFGPVAFTADAVVDAVLGIVQGGPDPEYRRRVDAAFPQRDGKCCERVVAAIRTSTRDVGKAHLSAARRGAAQS